jgi:hypothetical protein
MTSLETRTTAAREHVLTCRQKRDDAQAIVDQMSGVPKTAPEYPLVQAEAAHAQSALMMADFDLRDAERIRREVTETERRAIVIERAPERKRLIGKVRKLAREFERANRELFAYDVATSELLDVTSAQPYFDVAIAWPELLGDRVDEFEARLKAADLL